MIDSLYLAWRYVSFNRWKTLTLIVCVTLIAILPLLLKLLLTESERQMLARAEATPLVIGAKGSALDLLMNALYFGDEAPPSIDMGASEQIWESGLAQAVPLYVRFKAREAPIVGTTLDYFELRGLEIAEGRRFGVLGDCVLGAEAAVRLGLAPGDSLLSTPENLFDLAGVYPLKMTVAGVLERRHSADDLAVFVDLKTAWVIEGLGHGHGNVTQANAGNAVADPSLAQYTEITAANLDSFHFHGDPSGYPISAVIAVPLDDKAATILRGRYLDPDSTTQIMIPQVVIGDLLQTLFRIKNVLDAVILVVSLATVLAVLLVLALSLRLRQREIQTIFKLGCQRATIVRLVAAEITIITLCSALLCVAGLVLAERFAGDLVRLMFFS